jgi:hypothetical protein
VKSEVLRVGILAQAPGAPRERDLAWYDWSLLNDLSADGRSVLFSESGEGGGPGYSVSLRATDGSPAVRLGEGEANSISADGKWVLARLHPTAANAQLLAYPTGPGETKTFSFPGLRPLRCAWLPDGRRFLLLAAAPGREPRVFVVNVDGGEPRPLTSEGAAVFVPLDARRCAVRNVDGSVRIVPVDGGEPTAVVGIGPTDVVLGPSAREGWIYLRHGRTVPANVVLSELATGREEKWKELMPADATGIIAIPSIRILPDGRAWAYSYGRILSDLFALEGLK